MLKIQKILGVIAILNLVTMFTSYWTLAPVAFLIFLAWSVFALYRIEWAYKNTKTLEGQERALKEWWIWDKDKFYE